MRGFRSQYSMGVDYEKIIRVGQFATQFVEKIIYVEQLNECIAKDVLQKLDPVKMM